MNQTIKLSAIAVFSVFASAAIAQAQVQVYSNTFELIDFQSIPDAFDEEYSEFSGEAFDRGRLFGPVQSLVGLPLFPDTSISRDLNDVHKLYVELLNAQNTSGPILRTPDLPNPFSSTLLSNPAYFGTRTVVPGSEFIFEVAPIR
ncbi:hypothetical protein IQ249_07575 [Lusitaniella coriacea LEGE 07157]|uniref:PEP-CTERM sorting domain-containing protein n=1 Tax=Lusitaniella coriacea LEGE 07157 TaxID=945747 RepID=A0A8J7DVD5_9CYAN|nr:hypothetical protein [Lusitaniella coriacea]MBE9115749.1 hypothetical protein [Lusitaniella coriacea LEGE 07157]